MKTNELKKGDRVILRHTSWPATVMDNRKGNTRMCEVRGMYTEMGSVYSHDIEYYVPDGLDLDDVVIQRGGTVIMLNITNLVEIEHTPAQNKLRDTVRML